MTVSRRVGSFFWSAINGVRVRIARPTVVAPSSCRVWSVANTEAGGTGKTPFVQEICRRALLQGKTVWILSHGVNGALSAAGAWVGSSVRVISPRQYGDEPANLKYRFPQIGLGIGKDRRKTLTRALIETRGEWPDLLVLDDGGEQHWLRKDVEFWMLRGAGRKGKAWFRRFPRDLRSSSSDCQTVRVWSKDDQPPEGEYDFALGRTTPIRSRAGVLLTTVAHPDEVRASVEQSGGAVHAVLGLADHSDLEKPEVMTFIRRYFHERRPPLDGYVLWMTSKDWIKWNELVLSGVTWTKDIPVEELIQSLTIRTGEDRWEAFWSNGL